MSKWQRCAGVIALMAAAGGCGAVQDDGPAPTSGPNQAAAASPDPVAEAEEDFKDAMKSFEDVVLTVPGDGTFEIVLNATQGEMWPGQWETIGPSSPAGPCSWSLIGQEGQLVDSAAIDVDSADSDYVVTVTETGSVFTTSGCADWHRVNGS